MKPVPMPWKIVYDQNEAFDCAAFVNSGYTCHQSPTGCHPSASFLLFGDPGDSHNPLFCATHYFQELGDGTQFDDYHLAPKDPVCPRCKCTYKDFPALSRRDNATYICSHCGQTEAFEDAGFVPTYTGTPYWEAK